MAKKFTADWDAVDRYRASKLQAALLAGLPGQWHSGVRGMAAAPSKQKFISEAPAPQRVWVWDGPAELVDRLQRFAKLHSESIRWNFSEPEIAEKSHEIAGQLHELMHCWHEPLSLATRLDVMRHTCNALGVPYPVAITGDGAIKRATSPVWWRRVMRKKVARSMEHGAIKMGLVNRKDGGYASDGAVERRGAQLARNLECLKKAVMVNEAGQYFSLAELAKASTANPEIRGGELMTRIRGCEEYAQQRGHIGLFWTLTVPSRFHAVLVGGRTAAHAPRPNPKYDGTSSPRDAQLWLRTMWGRARAQLARQGVQVYGFRVAEPHHDGTPHWHALLWVQSQADADKLIAVMRHHWLSDDGTERGADKHRLDCKPMTSGGAAGYMAKYVAKNIGHFDVGQHLDADIGNADQLQAVVWAGDVQGWQRVDAWAATWGIRQFQAIGQPGVSLWRELRRVSTDQIQQASRQGDAIASRLWHAAHRSGDIAACWHRFMAGMGGACLPRKRYALQAAKRCNEVVNAYGETVQEKRTVGVVLPSGRWLISRRQAWARAVSAPPQSANQRAACGLPWTGFNNCTARLVGRLRAALLNVPDPIDGSYQRGSPGCMAWQNG